MSRILGRLRLALGDPLLVRAGRELVPTPAAALHERVAALTAEARDLFAGAASSARSPAPNARCASAPTTAPSLSQTWHPRFDRDPAHRLLSDSILDLARRTAHTARK